MHEANEMIHPLISQQQKQAPLIPFRLTCTSSPFDGPALSASSSPTARSTMGRSLPTAPTPSRVGHRCGWDGEAWNEQQQLRCPRCDSHNTKFSYYNNYSRMQPRHNCKACRRYWTQGGTLRDVPVAGGHMKSKRQKKTAQANSAEAEADPFRGLNSEQFSHVDLERSIFPSFHRTMMYSVAGGDEAMSLLSPPLLLPEMMTETYSGSGIFNRPQVPASSSSNSHHSHQIGQEGTTADDLLLTLMPGSTTEWLQDPPSLLSNYCSPAWWDDAGELAAFGQPATANDHC